MSFKGMFSKRNLTPSLLSSRSKPIDGKGGTWPDLNKSSSLPNIAETITTATSPSNEKSTFPDGSLNGTFGSGLNTDKGGKAKALLRNLRWRSLGQPRNKLKGKDSFKPKSGQSGTTIPSLNGAVRISYENTVENTYEYPGSNSSTKKDGEDVTLESIPPQIGEPPNTLENHKFSNASIGYLNAPKRGAKSKSVENIFEYHDDVDYMVEQGISTDSTGYKSAESLQEITPVHLSMKPPSNEQFLIDRPPARPPKPLELRGEPLNKPCDDNEHVPPQPPARQPTCNMNRTFPSIRAVKLLHGNRESGAYESIDEKPSHIVERSLPWELRKLPQQPWYWGPLTQEQAEWKLRGLPDGYFLVRDSSDDRYLLSLSFNSNGRPVHTRFEHVGGLFSINDSQGYVSVVDLIEDAVRESQNGIYSFMQNINGTQTFPARLTNPVSRFTAMKSLQHLCRFVIRETFPRHFVADLPVPEKIRKYILEYQY